MYQKGPYSPNNEYRKSNTSKSCPSINNIHKDIRLTITIGFRFHILYFRLFKFPMSKYNAETSNQNDTIRHKQYKTHANRDSPRVTVQPNKHIALSYKVTSKFYLIKHFY